MMPILVKGDDVRSGAKATARHWVKWRKDEDKLFLSKLI